MKRKGNFDNISGYLFIMPQLVGIFIFSVLPLVAAVGLSFFKWDLLDVPQFVGLKNYITQFTQPDFGNSMLNTLKYIVVYIPLNLILSLGIAALLNNIAFKTFYRTIFFLPVVTSSVAVSMIWLWIYSDDFGILNLIIRLVFHGKGIGWLTSTTWVVPSIAIMSVWWSVGYNMVLFMAGLQGISRSYYESAELDGANALSQFWHITLPLLSPTTLFISIVTIISSFQVFDQIFIMTDGGPGKASEVIVKYIYTQGFQNFKMGDSTAAAVILFSIIMVLTIIQFKTQDRWVHYDN